MAILRPLDIEGTPREWGLKLLEEASEACEAMKACASTDHFNGSHAEGMHAMERGGALRELVDVLQVVCGCLHEIGVTPNELDDAITAMRLNNFRRGRHDLSCAAPLVVWMGNPCHIWDEESGDVDGSDD